MMHETERYPDWARSMKHAQEDIGLLMAHLMEWKAIFDQELPTDTAAGALDRAVTALELATSEMMVVLSALDGDDMPYQETEGDAFSSMRRNAPDLYDDPTEEELDED
ncbi:hypothetical protein [Sulfobacillus sp. hq2]|nr:hypothetical protein [Sulfobacillus sp. hq2]POB12105.1 hypothetical protein CO251_01445 [Sulfobacillus sp. hq2]